jgi:hypothetical protein
MFVEQLLEPFKPLSEEDADAEPSDRTEHIEPTSTPTSIPTSIPISIPSIPIHRLCIDRAEACRMVLALLGEVERRPLKAAEVCHTIVINPVPNTVF